MRSPAHFHYRGDELEDLIKEKLRAAERLIDEALKLVAVMRGYDLRASYSLAPAELDPDEFARLEKKKKAGRRRRK